MGQGEKDTGGIPAAAFQESPGHQTGSSNPEAHLAPDRCQEYSPTTNSTKRIALSSSTSLPTAIWLWPRFDPGPLFKLWQLSQFPVDSFFTKGAPVVSTSGFHADGTALDFSGRLV